MSAERNAARIAGAVEIINAKWPMVASCRVDLEADMIPLADGARSDRALANAWHRWFLLNETPAWMVVVDEPAPSLVDAPMPVESPQLAQEATITPIRPVAAPALPEASKRKLARSVASKPAVGDRLAEVQSRYTIRFATHADPVVVAKIVAKLAALDLATAKREIRDGVPPAFRAQPADILSRIA